MGILNPKGYTVYIMECADESYFTGMCSNLDEELKRVARQEMRHFKSPGRFPVKVVFQDTKLNFKEAYLKRNYLSKLNRRCRKKLIDTKKWPAGKMLRPLILEKMKKNLADPDDVL